MPVSGGGGEVSRPRYAIQEEERRSLGHVMPGYCPGREEEGL